MGRSVGIALEADRGDRDGGQCCQLLFPSRPSGIPHAQAEAPSIVVNDDIDMIRVIESRGRPSGGRFVEGPSRLSGSRCRRCS
jgi:hypothetical protein